MTYRELLKLCIEKPGCIQTREQKTADSNMRYHIWLNQTNEDYLKEKVDNKTNK